MSEEVDGIIECSNCGRRVIWLGWPSVPGMCAICSNAVRMGERSGKEPDVPGALANLDMEASSYPEAHGRVYVGLAASLVFEGLYPPAEPPAGEGGVRYKPGDAPGQVCINWLKGQSAAQPGERAVTHDGYEVDLMESLRRFVRYCYHGRESAPRWVHVKDSCGHGSGFSIALCRWAGVDPDEVVGESATPPAAEVCERTHELKTWPQYFEALIDGRKTFEYRKDDRGFKVGDVLWLREYDPETQQYTRRDCYRLVDYTARGGLIPEGYVIMSVSPAEPDAKWCEWTPYHDGAYLGSCRRGRPEGSVVYQDLSFGPLPDACPSCNLPIKIKPLAGEEK